MLTRPINIKPAMTSFPMVDKSLVIPKDKPVVPKAEVTSTMIEIKETSSIAVKKNDTTKAHDKREHKNSYGFTNVFFIDITSENMNMSFPFQK